MKKSELLILLTLKRMKLYKDKELINLYTNTSSSQISHHTNFDTKLNSDELEHSKKILDFCEKENIRVITYFDSNYPKKLKNLSSPPIVLFMKGNLELINLPSIAMVGSRNSSSQALEWTYDASKKIASCGFVIISGGARGIDSYAHKGALESHGKTICVLGSGFSNIYPNDNKPLIDSIMKQGLVITEYLPEVHVNRFSLLERNKITSGLSDKVLLVAATIKGGAMSQFRVALSQKKHIFCPSVSLKLEPTAGITEILNNYKTVHSINEVEDIFNPKHNSEDQHDLLEAYC